MLEQGEVQELGMVPSGGGRPFHAVWLLLRIPDYGDYLWASAGGQELYSYACCGSERAEAVGERQGYMEEIGVESFDGCLDEVFAGFGNIGLIAFGLPGEAIDDVVTINDFSGWRTRFPAPYPGKSTEFLSCLKMISMPCTMAISKMCGMDVTSW